MLKKMFIFAISALGTMAATMATQGCAWIVWDEPKAPKSLIEQ